METAYVEIRSQHAAGIWPRSGPDTYVAVQIVPDGIEPLKQLNYKVAAKRGIRIVYCGEGYRNRQATSKSSLGAAIKKANEIAKEINQAHNKAQAIADSTSLQASEI